MGSKKDKTREFIIETSYAIFAHNGFNAITMKDICEATQLSRGGLYSHFASTQEIFEAILVKMKQKKEMNFAEEMQKGECAVTILENALLLMEDEMNHPEDSLSLAMYEYTGNVATGRMEEFNKLGEDKWTSLIEYGIARGEFRPVVVEEIVNVILYVYQGVRMWSRIVKMSPETMQSITSHIRKQLVQ